MKRYTLILSIAVGLSLAATSVSVAQRTPGNVFSMTYSREDGLVNCHLSPDGLYAIIEFEKHINCISTADARTIWSREYKEEHFLKSYCITWVGIHEVVVPTEVGLEWIDAATGTVFTEAPFLDGGLEAFLSQGANDKDNSYQIRPRVFGNVLLVPLTSGYQLFDLAGRREFYRSGEVLDEIHIEHCGLTVLIYGEMDTAVVFDVERPRILAKHAIENGGIDRCRYKNLVRHNEQIAIFTESNVVCFNAVEGRSTGVIDCDLDDMDTYDVILLKDDLCLLTSDDDVLGFYNIAQAKKLWSSNYGEAKRATPTDVWPLQDSSILVAMFDEDFILTLVRFDGATGTVLWERRTMKYSRKGRPGLAYQKVFSLGLEKKSYDKVKLQAYSPVRLDSTGRQTFYSQLGVDSTRPYQAWEFISLLNRQFLHQDRYDNASVRFLGQYETDLVFQSVGDLRRAWDGKESETEYDAEGILRLNVLTGEVKNFTSIPFYRDLELGGANVVQYFWPVPVESGSVIYGARTVALLRLDGRLESIDFSLVDNNLIRIGEVGKDYAALSYRDDNQNNYYWRALFTREGIKRELMGYCDECDVFNQISDSAYATMTLRYTDGKLEGHSVMSELPVSWPKPLWTLSNDQLQATGIDDVIVSNKRAGTEGIYQYKDKVYILGADAFGVFDPKSVCLSTVPWEGYDEAASMKFNTNGFIRKLKNGVIYDLGSDVGIIKLGQGCEATLIGSNNEHRKDLVVTYSDQTQKLIVIDIVDDRLDIYQIR